MKHEPSKTWLQTLSHIGQQDMAQALAPWLQDKPPRFECGLGPVDFAGESDSQSQSQSEAEGRSDLSLKGHDPNSLTLELFCQGPDAAFVRDPITVELEAPSQERTRVERLGPGPLRLPAPQGVEALHLDPDRRLFENWHVRGEIAQFNNHTPHKWRLLVTNLTSLLAVTNRQLSLGADLTLRRIFELRRRFGFSFNYQPGSVGGLASVAWAFGPEITPLVLSHSIGLSLSGNGLLSEPQLPQGGWQSALTLSYLYDTRLNPFSSFRGRGLNAYVTLGGAKQHSQDLSISTYDGKIQGYAQAGIGALKLWPWDLHRALLLRLRLDWVGAKTPPQLALRLGGRYLGLRGYESNELRGTARGLASLEVRHTLSADSFHDVLGLVGLTRLEGALFADFAYLHHKDPTCSRHAFYDVGYGIRFLMDVAHISPSLVAFDVGMPLVRCESAASRLPLAVYVAFLQSLLLFERRLLFKLAELTC